MKVILLGPPGAGKGTHAKRLEPILHVPHIASGDLFRDIRREDSDFAREVRGYMDRGEYVPDAATIKMVLQRLAEPDAADGFLLDGFPRTVPQAQALDAALTSEGRRIDCALSLAVPDDVLVARIADRVICPQCHAIYNLKSKPPRLEAVCDVCGHALERRTDEEPDVIRKRVQAFVDQTKPVVEHYRKKGILVEINGDRPIPVVEADVDRAFGIRVER